jgi:NitT/TauT family transport system substrate-binding protein
MSAIPTPEMELFQYGDSKGLYKAEGIDLSVKPGTSSATTVQTVASGADDFGYVDGSVVEQLASKGVGVKAVMGVINQSPLSILVPDKSGIKSPQELVDKKLGYTAGAGPATLFPAVLGANHLDKSKITMVNLGTQAKLTAVLRGQVDAILGLAFFAPILDSLGMKANPLLFGDLGVNVPGYVLITSDKMIKEHPEIVKRVVSASIKSRDAMAADPDAAAADYLKRHPDSKAPGNLASVKQLVGLYDTAATKGKPSGYIDPQQFVDGYQTMVKYAGVKGGLDPSKFFTNEFVQ